CGRGGRAGRKGRRRATEGQEDAAWSGPPRPPPGRARAHARRTRAGRASMAEYLATFYGTEKDKVNCSFYHKIGACRHGARCSRQHNKPAFSNCILLRNFYPNPEYVHRLPDGRETATMDEVAK